MVPRNISFFVALILEFECHRGEIVSSFAKRKKRKKGIKCCWERPTWVDAAQLDASRRGKKGMKTSRDKNAFQGKNRSGEGWKKAYLATANLSCDCWSGGREQRRANIIHGRKVKDVKWYMSYCKRNRRILHIAYLRVLFGSLLFTRYILSDACMYL